MNENSLAKRDHRLIRPFESSALEAQEEGADSLRALDETHYVPGYWPNFQAYLLFSFPKKCMDYFGSFMQESSTSAYISDLGFTRVASRTPLSTYFCTLSNELSTQPSSCCTYTDSTYLANLFDLTIDHDGNQGLVRRGSNKKVDIIILR